MSSIGQVQVARRLTVDQLLGVESKQMQQGGVIIGVTDPIDDGLVAEVIGGAIVDATPGAAAGEENGVRVRIVIAAD